MKSLRSESFKMPEKDPIGLGQAEVGQFADGKSFWKACSFDS